MEIKDIKNKLSLTDVLKHYHFESDRNQRLCCPWHEDKTPSLQIYPKTNTWTCFSSNCSAGSGDQIDFIMKLEKISKHEALMKAKELLGHTEETKEEEDLNKLFSQMRAELLRSKKALSYMEERSLDSKTINGRKYKSTHFAQQHPCLCHCIPTID